MITGTHVMFYSKNAEADRAFLRDVLGFGHVDAGGGWLIFALPPAEVAIHPAPRASAEFYLMCDDVDAEIARLTALGRACDPITEERWGRLTRITLPSGAMLGLYQPKHKLAHE